nr:hypothetical protein [Flammeovirgaceae bacterium]
MATFNPKFVLDKSKKSTTGECPIFIRVYFNKKRLMHFTGEKVSEKDWDPRNLKIRPHHNFSNEINKRLNKLVLDLETHYQNFISKGHIPTVQQLKSLLLEGAPVDKSISDLLSDYIEHMKVDNKAERTIQLAQKLKEYVETFQKDWSL